MKFTKEQILEKVSDKDINFFESLYNGYFEDDEGNEQELDNERVITVYEKNWGDGNDWIVVLYFPELDIYVKLNGYYSSWDSSELLEVTLAEPYEYKETRYREIK